MYGGISLIGWFHTIIGTAGIISGLYLLSRFKFIDIWSSLGKFYLTCTFITSASSLFIYVAVNMCMVLGLLPIVGSPLPIMSYGGSAMLATMFGLSMVMSSRIYKDELIP